MNKPRIFEYDAVVAGTGYAAYTCALNIKNGGKSVAVICENMDSARGQNAGCDGFADCKQSQGQMDENGIYSVARELFSRGAVDGDNAICKAMFMKDCCDFLSELCIDSKNFDGIGHLNEVLEEKVEKAGIPIFDRLLAVKVLTSGGKVLGLLCISTESGSLAVFRTPNVILCTGAPLEIYADTVSSDALAASSSLFLLAGARMQNLTEWQYGLKDKNYGIGISGPLLTALPCFISVDRDGNEREFLSDYFGDMFGALSSIYAKGTEWLFDPAKVKDGTSVIDLLVYRECITNKRRVFLDYTKNPFGIENIDYALIPGVCKEHLDGNISCLGTPVERLYALGTDAADAFSSKGIDISADRLEISLGAVGCNGGASVDRWWHTGVTGLYAIGECAGTGGICGVDSPVTYLAGAIRASRHVSLSEPREVERGLFYSVLQKQAGIEEAFCETVVKENDNADALLACARRRFSDVFGAVRDVGKMEKAIEAIQNDIALIYSGASVSHKAYLYKAYKLRDTLYSQLTIAYAMLDYAKRVKKSRGGAVYPESDGNGGISGNDLRFTLDNSAMCRFIQEISLSDEGISSSWRRARQLPESTEFMDEIY